MSDASKIGVFDSGVGGLSVARQIWSELPDLGLHYFADTRFMPYGERPASEVVALVERVVNHLLESGAGAIVMACNTATALALDKIKPGCPVPVIGMIRPAIQAALKASRSGKIAVISNSLTARLGAYQKECPETQILALGCPSLVRMAESGPTQGPIAREELRLCLQPALDWGVDTLILGCTHFAFFRSELESLLGPTVRIIDPADYVVKRLRKLGLVRGGRSQFIEVSGEARSFEKRASRLLGYPISASHKDLAVAPLALTCAM